MTSRVGLFSDNLKTNSEESGKDDKVEAETTDITGASSSSLVRILNLVELD